MHRIGTGILAAILACWPLAAQPSRGVSSQTLAPAPPMGWNSWDSYGLTITEPQFQANVAWFHQHLQPFGWQYVIIDEGWYLRNPASGGKPSWQYTLNPDGQYMPAVNRFPSAAQGAGFRPLADSVHAMGLKFGIHIIRGIPREAVARNLPIAGSPYHAADAADRGDTCAWNPDNYGLKPNAAGQAYYDSIAKLYASWGVDYVKVDCISQPYKKDEIHMMSAALKKTGRPIVLSLSPGPTPLADAADVRTVAQMWRISNDVWDNWTRAAGGKWSPQTVLEQFPLTAAWAPYAGPGHWPDADMLPVGYLGPVPGWGQARSTRLTQDEQRTLLSLWSIFRSPLMIGANLTRSDAFTASLFTNPEVLAVDQHSTGNHPVVQSAETVVWTAATEDGRGHYLAVFNLADSPRTVNYPWQALGLKPGKYRVRDLWERKDLGDESGLRVDLRPHASVLYRVAP